MLHNQMRYGRRRGAVLVLIVAMIVVLLGMVAFALDVGRMYVVRSQLQSAIDAGTLAAGLQLKENPQDVDAAVAAAEDFIQRNRVGWLETVPADAITVEAGAWNADTRTFTPGAARPDAVRVSASAENEPLMFARVFGRDAFSVPRAAVAHGGGKPLDIVMTLDLSGSMGSEGRIEALQSAAPVFVNVIEDVGDDDRIAVMGYGALPDKYKPKTGVLYTVAPQTLYPPDSDWVGVLESPLTNNFSYLRSDVLDASSLIADKYNGWTPIGAALRDSAHYLSLNGRSDVEQVIVLMSDGHANKPDQNGPGYARTMAQYAAGLGIKVYTISLGNSADEILMQDIADATGGKHFIARGTGSALKAALTNAFQKVANSVKSTQLVQ